MRIVSDPVTGGYKAFDTDHWASAFGPTPRAAYRALKSTERRLKRAWSATLGFSSCPGCGTLMKVLEAVSGSTCADCRRELMS